ncbi:CU044_2847 family protein [Marichromatium gracile]|uniref:CU044_2847 family protein n=1 Tax=Marichromatium gracile TaxID=1048 RepID=UPI001F5BCB79|nr:CU044_2847 family protein [Marichromatium gracile]
MGDRERTRWQLLSLEEGNVYIEVLQSGRQEVSDIGALSFGKITDVLRIVMKELGVAVDSAKPTKASVEVNFEFALEAGEIVALIARGSSKANLKVLLEWDNV